MPSSVASRPALRPLLRQLASDSVRWADAELDLARLEFHALLRRCIAAVVFAVAGFAALLTALIILAQTGVEAAAPNLGDVAAGVAVGVATLLLAALCALGMRRMFRWEAESLVFRWFAPSPDQKRTPQWTN
ncbi:MAG: phage holin family protein [Rhizobiales bacterium]|nr:phage holin family protein [Hyphomicrobiales bacterium]